MDGPPRSRLPSAIAAALLLASLLAAGLLLRGREGPGGGAGVPGEGPKPDPAVEAVLAKHPDLAGNRVLVLGLDGADPLYVADALDAGRLPNFRRLAEEGAFGALRSQQPMLSPLLWTTIATGKWPTEHGVLDFLIRDEDDPEKRTTVSSRNRQVEALWDIAGRHGRKVAVVGWLASHPAERVNGWAVSERTERLAYLFGQKPLPTDEGKTWPPELMEELRPLRREPPEVTLAEVAPFLEVTPEEYRRLCRDDVYTDQNRVNNMRLMLATSGNFEAMGLHLWREKRPDLLCLYFEDVDAACHNFMAYREPITWKPLDEERILAFFKDAPAEPGKAPLDPAVVKAVVERVRDRAAGQPPLEVAEDQRGYLPFLWELATGADPERVRRWGRAVDAAYDEADRILGEVMAAMDDRTTLLVVSDHGFKYGEDKPPFDSSFKSKPGGANYHREDGILGAFGRGVKRGARILQMGPGARRPVDLGKWEANAARWRRLPAPPAKGPPDSPFSSHPLVLARREFPRERLCGGATLHDVAPTALALLGFPKAKDMPGRVLRDLFDAALPTEEIETYESGRSTRLARERMERDERRRLDGGGADPVEDAALDDAMKQIAAVGYVGTAEEGPIRALLHMVASYVQERRFEEAEEALSEALKASTPGGRPRLLVQLGDVRRSAAVGDTQRSQGALDGAAEAYRTALAEKPGFLPAIVGLARTLEEKGDRAGALPLWEEACGLSDNPTMDLRHGDALRQSAEGAEPGARAAALEKAIAILREVKPPSGDPEDPAWKEFEAVRRNYLGMALVDAGRFDESEAALREAADLLASYVKPRNNLSVVSMRKSWQALEEARREQDPARREALLRTMAKHREEALLWIDGVLAIDEGNPKARYNRAEILVRLLPADPEAAEKELLLALESAPNYRRARQLLDAVRAALPGRKDAPPPPR